MSANSKRLGRGLDVLLPKNDPEEKPVLTENICIPVSVDALVPNPNQPRTNFSEDGLRELADSILKRGVLQPILARENGEEGKYQIVAGERRWRAARLAGMTHVPVLVRQLNDTDAFVVALIENFQREDLNPIEYAKGLMALKETLGTSMDELAQMLGMARSSASNFIRLLKLDAEATESLLNGRISMGHARCILSVPPGECAEELHKRIIDEDMTVREAEAAAKFWQDEQCFPWQKKPDDSDGNAKERMGKSPEMERLTKDIESVFNCRAKISGNAERGRISLAYDSNEQLFEILEKFGMSMDSFHG